MLLSFNEKSISFKNHSSQRLVFNKKINRYDDFDIFVASNILNSKQEDKRDSAITRALLMCYLNVNGFKDFFESVIETQMHTIKGSSLEETAISLYSASKNLRYAIAIEEEIRKNCNFKELRYSHNIATGTNDLLTFSQNKELLDKPIKIKKKFELLKFKKDSILGELIPTKESIFTEDERDIEELLFSTSEEQPIKDTIIKETPTLFDIKLKENDESQEDHSIEEEENDFFKST